MSRLRDRRTWCTARRPHGSSLGWRKHASTHGRAGGMTSWVVVLDHAPKLREVAFRMGSLHTHEYLEEDGLESGVHEREPLMRQDEAVVAVVYS